MSSLPEVSRRRIEFVSMTAHIRDNLLNERFDSFNFSMLLFFEVDSVLHLRRGPLLLLQLFLPQLDFFFSAFSRQRQVIQKDLLFTDLALNDLDLVPVQEEPLPVRCSGPSMSRVRHILLHVFVTIQEGAVAAHLRIVESVRGESLSIAEGSLAHFPDLVIFPFLELDVLCVDH